MNFHRDSVVSDQAWIIRFCWKAELKFAARIVPNGGTKGGTRVAKLAKCLDLQKKGSTFSKTMDVLFTCCCNVCPVELAQEVIQELPPYPYQLSGLIKLEKHPFIQVNEARTLGYLTCVTFIIASSFPSQFLCKYILGVELWGSHDTLRGSHETASVHFLPLPFCPLHHHLFPQLFYHIHKYHFLSLGTKIVF